MPLSSTLSSLLTRTDIIPVSSPIKQIKYSGTGVNYSQYGVNILCSFNSECLRSMCCSPFSHNLGLYLCISTLSNLTTRNTPVGQLKSHWW